MHTRHMAGIVEESLEDSAAVYIQGARQVGKSTLAKALPGRRYLTLDDATTLAAAASDPQGFVDGLPPRVTLDEVQRVDGLALALKRAIDRDRTPGRFLLTGSTRILVLPALADALVGRMEVLTLWPLAQCELVAGPDDLVDRLFSDRLDVAVKRGASLEERLVAGGFPEVVRRRTTRSRRRWFETYLTTVLQREVRAFAQVDDLAVLPRLLGLLAARQGATLNVADLSRQSGIPQSTLRRYLTVLEGAFLTMRVPSWSTNLGKRLTKSPKVYVVDAGLAAHLRGVDAAALVARPSDAGALVEGFVVQELVRAASWSDVAPRLSHFRTPTGLEVDIVMEDHAGRVVGVEIKRAHSVGARDLRGLRRLAELAGDRFVRGVVLYGGEEVLPLGPRLTAVPIACLWASYGDDGGA